ncbi:MAG: hypothetical protein KF881_11410 [Acidobacteria bacterium]|nr:hypothetical protein [Acidobacteriota bacterium]
MKRLNDTAKFIIEMRDADLALREMLVETGELFDGYNAEMEALHIRNAEALESIINEIGYPTADKVGEAASDAAWLIIQHAISRPDFMRKCAQMLEKAVAENRADAKQLAYLTDRIAVFEGRPQLYGTQFDWDESGEMSPSPFDDIQKVERRRKAVGLNSLAEQTSLMRASAAAEHEFPPAGLAERRQQSDEWKRRIGWIE